MEVWELAARERVRDTLARYYVVGRRLKPRTAGRRLLSRTACSRCGGRPPSEGREAIVASSRAASEPGDDEARRAARLAPAKRPGVRRIVRHLLTNTRMVEVAPNRARVESYFTVVTEIGLDHHGRYRDVLVPVGDDWLIRHRFVWTDWPSETPLDDGRPPPPSPDGPPPLGAASRRLRHARPPARSARVAGRIAPFRHPLRAEHRITAEVPPQRAPDPKGESVDSVTRRSFLIKGSAGAVGAAGIIAGGIALTATTPRRRCSCPAELDLADDGAVLVQIRDAAAGEVEILVDEREIVFTDKALVARCCGPPAEEELPMSSHREAPAISKDPVADNTDTYAFVSPDRPDTVTIIANYIPLEDAGRRPELLRVRRRRALRDQHRQRRRRRRRRRSTSSGSRPTITQPEHVPLQHRPDHVARQPELEPPPDLHGHQGRRDGAAREPTVLGADLPCPPCNIGPRSTPNYAGAGRRGGPRRSRGGEQGVRRPARRGLLRRPRLGLRPRHAAAVPEPAPRSRRADAAASTRCEGVNVHTIAIQVPIAHAHPRRLRARPTRWTPKAVIGVWGAAQPAEGASSATATARRSTSGPCVQVSRLGNPLFNEVIVPMAQKDEWNARPPTEDDASSPSTCAQPGAGEAAAGALPRRVPEPRRADTARPRRPAGDPADRHPRRASSPGSRTSPGPTQADVLRLNMAIPPTAEPEPARARSAATSPASPTAAASPTTWSPSSCGPSPARRTRWSTRRSRPTARPASSRTARSAPRRGRSSTTFPYLGVPVQRLRRPGGVRRMRHRAGAPVRRRGRAARSSTSGTTSGRWSSTSPATPRSGELEACPADRPDALPHRGPPPGHRRRHPARPCSPRWPGAATRSSTTTASRWRACTSPAARAELDLR